MRKKQAILNAGILLFARKGFQNTAMTELARLSEVADGTVFYHYKTKDDLFVAILDHIREDIEKAFQERMAVAAHASGLDAVLDAVTFYLDLASRMEDEFNLLHRHYTYDFAKVNPAFRSHLETIYECFIRMFERSIRKGLDDGSIRKLDERKTALLIYSMTDGLVRLRLYSLYDSGALYGALMEACRRMLENRRNERAE
ncbi:MAG: TetR/AcrR family transcriptional regulator [Desulfobacterales bacterium]